MGNSENSESSTEVPVRPLLDETLAGVAPAK